MRTVLQMAKTRHLVILPAVLLVLEGIPTSSWSHRPAGVTYYTFQFPDGHLPVLDGDLSEWDIVPEAYVIRTEDMYELHGGQGKEGVGMDLRDFAARVIVGWSDTTNRLYLMAEVFDDTHQADRAIDRWDDDSWNITIDADHSGGRYAWLNASTEIGEEEAKRLHHAQATWYGLAEPPVQGVDFYTRSTWTSDQGEFFDVGWDFKGDMFGESTYAYELFIYPFDDLNWMGPEVSKAHDLREGETIGLVCFFYDYDLLNTPDACWTISDGHGAHAESLSDFYLCPVDPVFAALGLPEMNVEFSTSVCRGEVPLTVQFSDQSVGKISYYAWDFGDGGKSTEQNPEHTYKVPGVYTVTLEVMGPGGVGREEKEACITVRGRISEAGVRIPEVSAVPGERVRVPVLVDDVSNLAIVSLALSVTYERGWLEGLGVETEGTLLEQVYEEGIRWEMGPGDIRVEVTSSVPLVGEGALVYLVFTVSPSAEPGIMTRLLLMEAMVNGAPVGWVAEGEVGVTMVGDVSGNHQVTRSDAGLVLLASVGAIALPAPDYPNLRVGVGDVDRDGDMDEVDAAFMLQYTEDSSPPALLSLPDVHTSAELGALERREEGSLVIPIWVSEVSNVLAGRISLSIEGAGRPTRVVPGEGMEGYVFGHHVKGDSVYVAFAGRRSLSGSGRMVELYFEPVEEEIGVIRLTQVRLNGKEEAVGRGHLDASAVPGEYRLCPNYPNPFNVGTVIEFGLARRGKVEVSVWDVTGQWTRGLVAKDLPIGYHRVVWDGRNDSGGDVGSGVYVCRLRVNGFSQVRKMVLIR